MPDKQQPPQGKPIRETEGTASNSPPAPKKSLLRSGSLVGGFTMLSRVFGLLRDLVFAQLIGASASADAFYVAFKIPNFFRRLFSEGAFNQAFLPVLSDYQLKNSHDQVRYLVSRVSGTLAWILLVFTLLVVAFPEAVASVFAFGFRSDPTKLAYTAGMLQITFPYLLLISLTGMAGAILNAYDRFAVPAFTPVLLNVCLIGAAFVASRYMQVPAFGLAWGLLIAGVVQLLFQLPFLAKMHLLPWPHWGWSDSGVKRILKLMIPAIFGVSVSQINLLLDTVLASFLPTGSVSWLYYSDRLSELPLGVFGIAIATVILPNLSRQFLSKDQAKFNHTVEWALKMMLVIGLPAAVALMVLAKPILTTLFYYGEFRALDVEMSAWSLRAYACGLLGFMLVKVLAPAFYAHQDMKTPVKIGVIAMAFNMLLNLILVAWLHYSYQLGHVGLALATSISAMLNAYLLYRGLRKKQWFKRSAGWPKYLTQVISSVVLMALVLCYLQSIWSDWLAWRLGARVFYLSAICVIGLSAYLLVLRLWGLKLANFK